MTTPLPLPPTEAISQSLNYDAGLRDFMLKIYHYMAGALAVTGLAAFRAAQSEPFLNAVYKMDGHLVVGMTPLGWGIMCAPLLFALILGSGITRMSLVAAQLSFWGYAIVMGLSLSIIFLTYTHASAASIFLITASTFSAVSIYGYTTKRALSGVGHFLMMGVIGLIIASLVNLYLQSSAMQYALSFIAIFVFVGLTAYDTQKLRIMYSQLSSEGEDTSKTVIMGALTLYLDFINIFMNLLYLFGVRKN